MDDQHFIDKNNARNLLRRRDTLIDTKVNKWIGDGNMSGHSGAFEGLNLNDDQYTPEDERITYKLMRENDVVPEWMSLGFTLREKHQKFLERARQYAHDYVQRRNTARLKGSFLREEESDKRWQAAISKLEKEINNYNSELLDYNLTIPPIIGQIVPLDAAQLIDKALQQAESKF